MNKLLYLLLVVAFSTKKNRKHVVRVSVELYIQSQKFKTTRNKCGKTRVPLVLPQHFALE